MVGDGTLWFYSSECRSYVLVSLSDFQGFAGGSGLSVIIVLLLLCLLRSHWLLVTMLGKFK